MTSSRRTSKESKGTQRQLTVWVDVAKYRRAKTILTSMDSTVASFIRDSFDKLISKHD